MPDRPTLFIPQDALLESGRLLAIEGVSLADYSTAVEELILELVDRGILRLNAIDIGKEDNRGNLEHTRNIRAVFEATRDRRDRAAS